MSLIEIDSRKRHQPGSYTSPVVSVPARSSEDTTSLYSQKLSVALGLDAADLADPSLVIDLWIEVTDDPSGVTGWRRAATCGSWRGGRLARDGSPRKPSVRVSQAIWGRQPIAIARVGWSQSRAAFVSVLAEVIPLTFDKRTSRSVAIDAGSAAQGEAAGDSLTISVITAAGTDLLVVGIVNYDGDAAFAPSAVTATHNLDAMSSVATTVFGGDDAERSTMLYRVAPDIGTFDVIITPFDTTESDELIAAILAFSGVHQTTPLDAAQTDATDAVTSTTLNIARDTDDMVVSICGWFNQTVTVGGDLTQRVLNDNWASFESIVLATSAVDASIASTYSWAASENPGHIAVNINAAAAGGAAPNVSDTATIAEDRTVKIPIPANISDTVTIAEARSMEILGDLIFVMISPAPP